jgi:predicted component of type VI protein secretion system
MPTDSTDRLLGERQVSALTGLTLQQLREARRRSARIFLKPPGHLSIRIGKAHRVRYSLSEVIRWANENGIPLSIDL